jgi:HEAT repeat protein
MSTVRVVVCCLAAGAVAAAQPLRFDDVIRNLRNPDPKVRLSAIELLHEAKYPEALAPLAPLVNDPVGDVQLAAIQTELSFYLVEDVKARRRVGLVIEKRSPAVAQAAFNLSPARRWPRSTPPELVTALIKAIDDQNPRVRLEAIYALGVVAQPPLAGADAQGLIKALDHYDPAIRAAAADVIGRLNATDAGDALIKAINDSQPPVRYAAMHALGRLHDERAVAALTEQLKYYGKGEGAWSALEALARIAHPSSVPVFKERLADKDPNIRRAAAEGLGRAGDKSAMESLTAAATTDPSGMVRVAMAFALQKLGQNYAQRMVDAMTSSRVIPQVQEYLLELGPPVVPAILPFLQEPEPSIRLAIADVLGLIGGDAAVAPLQAATQDRDPDVAAAAKRALERLKLNAAPRGRPIPDRQ